MAITSNAVHYGAGRHARREVPGLAAEISSMARLIALRTAVRARAADQDCEA
jgi:hypothetical protein